MIRLPTPNDLPAIGHVYCAAWKAAYRGIVPDDFLDRLTNENCAPRSIPSKGAFICEREGLVIGTASFGAQRDGPDLLTGELYSIYVLPEYWETGAGNELFESVRKELRTDGYSTMFLWTLTENSRARRFYEKKCMTPTTSRTITIGGKELNETGYSHSLLITAQTSI